MVDIEHLRREAIRLGAIDRPAAQLLNAAGDEIQQRRTQVAALLQTVQARAAMNNKEGATC